LAELSIKEAIARLADGDDDAFEPLMKAICAGRIITAVRPYEGTDQSLDFLNYILDDMDYIPLFADKAELDEFYQESEAEGEYKVLELDGNFFADLMGEEQFLMINPVSGGIMFQGGHLKPFIDPAKLP
jgi:hypothetical protein